MPPLENTLFQTSETTLSNLYLHSIVLSVVSSSHTTSLKGSGEFLTPVSLAKQVRNNHNHTLLFVLSKIGILIEIAFD